MKMPFVMKATAAISGLLTVVFSLLKWTPAAITFGTIFYHFAMRLLVGFVLDRTMQNRANYNARWYGPRKWEAPVYKCLQVRKWKGRFPTYDPGLFDSKLHTMDEIVQATCQAEVVHEVIAVLSFLPLLGAIPFGSFWVFAITSLLSACFDMIFVIMQRFNRPRLIKLMERGVK